MKSFFLNKLIARQRLRLYVWLSLVSEILIVVTGGGVRLTASGLGCPTWPKCTEDSWISTPEMELHGLIEWGNRMLTFVLLIIAILTFAVALRVRREKKAVFRISIALGLGILLQAVIGGITVLTQLNAWVVGLHFMVSAVMISLATIMVWARVDRAPAVFSSQRPRSELLASVAISFFGLLSIAIGVVVTGAGPHAGDIDTPRNGLDLDLWQHFHSYPGYAMLAVLLVAVWLRARYSKLVWSDLRSRALLVTLAISLAQAVIGVIQARTGVPAILVAVHMLGAAVLAATLTWQQLALPRRTEK